MDFRKLYPEDLNLFLEFYQNNPLAEEIEDLEDRVEEIEDELRINKFKYFGFTEDNILIGYAKFRVDQDEVHLIGPFILPEHRRKGFGKEIIQRIENYCIHQKLKRINAYSFMDTKLAEEFLSDSGYKIESVTELGVKIYIKNLEEAV